MAIATAVHSGQLDRPLVTLTILIFSPTDVMHIILLYVQLVDLGYTMFLICGRQNKTKTTRYFISGGATGRRPSSKACSDHEGRSNVDTKLGCWLLAGLSVSSLLFEFCVALGCFLFFSYNAGGMANSSL